MTLVQTKSTIGIGALCLIGLVVYVANHPGSDNPPSTKLVWISFGTGVALTGNGIVSVTRLLSRKRRAYLARSLFTFGIIFFVLALVIAHVGPVLLILAIPALVFGAIVCLMY